MNIVKYIESVLGCKLQNHQREFVRKMCEAVSNNEILICNLPRGNDKFYFRLLESLVVLYIAKERGYIKEDGLAIGKTEEIQLKNTLNSLKTLLDCKNFQTIVDNVSTAYTSLEKLSKTMNLDKEE